MTTIATTMTFLNTPHLLPALLSEATLDQCPE
jgi:hypothetical protein